MLRRFVTGLLALVVTAIALWLFGPRDSVEREISFNPSVLGDDPEVWLQVSEQQYSDIRPGAAKRILWAGAKGQKTPVAIVYIHGFAASAEEIRPVPDEVARALGANLYFTRLTGQGRSNAAMGEATAGDWIEDMAEAMEIGRSLGDRVIVIGTSLGGALSAIAATDPELSRNMAGLVLVSPAFALHQPINTMIDAPFMRLWAPLVYGNAVDITPLNSQQAKYWATAWPTAASYPVGALLREARAQDYSRAKMPLLLFYAQGDKVVDPAAMTPAITTWGGSVEVVERHMQAGDDPSSHVIMGDVMSPGQTEEAVEIIVNWARGL